MKRVTVLLREDLLKKLQLMARERKISVSALAREAIEAKAGFYTQIVQKPWIAGIGDSSTRKTASALATARFPMPGSVDSGGSGRSDIARPSGEEWPGPPAWR